MKAIRHGELTLEAYQNFISHYYEATFTHLADKYRTHKPDLEMKEKIETLIMQLIKRKLV